MVVLVFTPSGQETFQATWLEVHVAGGTLVIQEEHAPCITSLQPSSEITLNLEDGKKKTIAVHKGVMHVDRHMVKFLLF